MKPFHLAAIFAAVAVAAAAPSAANAAAAVSNLGSLGNGAGGIFDESGDQRATAQSFITGSESFLLESATLAMENFGAGTGGFLVSLYSNSVDPDGDLPGTLLLTLDGNPAPLAAANFTFTAPSSFVLAPHTKYWIVAELAPGTPEGTRYSWSLTAHSSVTSLPGWSLEGAATRLTRNGSPSWGPLALPMRMSVEVQPVPEATTCWMALAGGLLVMKRRRVSRGEKN